MRAACSSTAADYRPKGPRDARAHGIAFIHQELNLFRNLSIEENLFIAGFPKLVAGLPFIDRRAARERAPRTARRGRPRSVADDAGQPAVARRAPAGRDRQGARQQGARHHLRRADDLADRRRETERLFDIIDRLRRQGIAIIYISHILGDVMRLCDDIVVLRDGHVVGTAPKAEMTIESMITLDGRPARSTSSFRRASRAAGTPARRFSR